MSIRLPLDRTLQIILLIGLAQGLLYVFLVPPWQHYDEPTHFEYAWLIANRPSLPQPDEFDQAMRREVAASMLEHGFFDGLNFRPNLLSPTHPIWIGLSQLRHSPAYYFVGSLPLRLVRFTDITFQLYVSRLVSLCLYLLSILIAWGAIKELIAPSDPLRWMVPATMALLPGYIDSMTSVNNDVGAVIAFSLFLLFGLRLLGRFSFFNLLCAAGAAALCVWMKETAWMALLLFPLFLLFSLLRGSRQRLAWAMLVIAAMGASVAVLAWDDAAFWYRDTSQSIGTRASVQISAMRNAVQIVEDPGDARVSKVDQLLPIEQVNALGDKTVTLGAWMWASKPIRARTPILFEQERNTAFYRDIELGTEPAFYAITATLPASATRAIISLSPVAAVPATRVTVYYGDVVLAQGAQPVQEIPQFDDPQDEFGFWGGQPFRNLARNGSAQDSWVRVRPWFESLGSQIIVGRPSIILASLLDWRGAGWYYWATAQNMLRTFWGKFGWGHVPLLGDRPYLVLTIFTAIGIAGVPLALWRARYSIRWVLILLLCIALIGIWFAAIVRGTVESLFGNVFIPGARYAYPAIIPTLVVLNAGWLELARIIRDRFRLPRQMQSVSVVIFFVALDLLAIASLINFYYVRR